MNVQEGLGIGYQNNNTNLANVIIKNNDGINLHEECMERGCWYVINKITTISLM